MKMNLIAKNTLIVCIFMMQPILISCSVHQDVELVDVDASYVNNQILVRAPESFNSYKTADPIVLEILNYSNNEIRFPNYYNLKIFKQTDREWIEIKEIPTTRLPEDDIIFTTSSAVRDLAVFPDLVDYSRNYTLRIYVVGDMKTDEGIKKVAASVDIRLSP